MLQSRIFRLCHARPIVGLGGSDGVLSHSPPGRRDQEIIIGKIRFFQGSRGRDKTKKVVRPPHTISVFGPVFA